MVRHKFVRLFRWLLRSSKLRSLIGKTRLYWYVKLRKKLNTQNSNSAFPATIKHNLRSLADFSSSRMFLLLDPLCVIETLEKQAKILVIGCRNELDLLILFSKGFSTKHVRGLDIISYSPLVDCGDMHRMQYADNTFDAVVCGWTLSYSRTPEVAASEIKRVTRSGGIVAVAVEYCSDTQGQDSLEGYSLADGSPRALNSTNDLVDLFSVETEDILFSHDAPAKRSHTSKGFVDRPSGVALIFYCRK